MHIIRYEELESHCVLEFCYSIRYPNFWNVDSIYVDYDDFVSLCPYLEKVIPDYKYFAPQYMRNDEWSRIESLALADGIPGTFFQEVHAWKEKDPEQKDFFWIYGV